MGLFSRSFKKYSRETDGSMTLLGLYFGIAMLIIGAMALDVSNLIAVRTQLQSAADFAAHAALYQRALNHDDATTAKAKALALVQKTYPHLKFGDMLKASDIHFGTYDKATGGFKVDENSIDAAVAFTGRNATNQNAVYGILSRLFGYDRWNVATGAVWETYKGKNCLSDGWIGQDVVDAQSNNIFKTGFCIHSNTEVQFNSGSTFESGVTVSSPGGVDTTVVPTSGYTSNIGLKDSIQQRYYNFQLTLNRMAEFFAGINVNGSDYQQTYLDGVDWYLEPPNPGDLPDFSYVDLPAMHVATSDFTEGSVNQYTCNGPNQQLVIDAVPTLKNVGIYTNCKVSFSQDSAVENVVLYTTNTDDRSINAPNGLRMGLNDHCASGGGVKFMTEGGFNVAQELQIYGSQVLAKGPIQFAAAANGVEGGSFISGETVDGTSNTTMGTCPDNGDEVFLANMIRLAG